MQPVTPDELTLLDDFFAAARTERSNPALVNIEQPADALSYSELHAATIRGARGLVRAGARAGTPIADFVAEGVLLVITMLSILKSGCVVVPLDPSSPAQRLCALLADCSAELAIAARCSVPMLQQKFRSAKDDADHEELHTRLPPLMAMDELLERCEPDASSATLTQGISCLPPSTARSLCHHIYTSGSTGAPKAVSVSHLAMRAYAQEKIRLHGIEPTSRVLVTSAHTWDPCIGDVLSTLAAGATICLAPRALLLLDLGRVLVELRVTHVCTTPSMWSMLRCQADLPEPLVVALGGEPLMRSLAECWLQPGSPIRMINTYGVTEAAVYQTTCALSRSPSLWRNERASVGVPMRTVRLALLAESPVELAAAHANAAVASQTGGIRANGGGNAADALCEVLIGGPQLAAGYLNRAELSASKFVWLPRSAVQLLESSGLGDVCEGDGSAPKHVAVETDTAVERWFRTGDVGSWSTEAGLWIHGRRDSQVKLRGMRVELEEIEAIARRCPIICAAAATVWQAELILFVQPSIPLVTFLKGSGSVAVQLELRRRLPQALQPSRILPLEALPLTPGGKLLRSALPEPLARTPTVAAGGGALRTKTERRMAAVWEQVLGANGVGPRAHFWELGGNSLQAVRMLRLLLGEQSGARFALRLCFLYRKPVLQDYAAWLDAGGADRAGRSPEQSTCQAVRGPDAAQGGAGGVGEGGDGASGGGDGDGGGGDGEGGEGDAEDEESDLCALATAALATAASTGNERLTAALIDARACVDGMINADERGTSPLMRAALLGHAHCVSLLVGRRASLDLQNATHGATAVHLAAGARQPRTLQMLLAAGGRHDTRDRHRWTALFSAALGGCEACVELLLQAGAPAADVDRWSYTPLCWACCCAHVGVARLLLAAGAPVHGLQKPLGSPHEPELLRCSSPLLLALRHAVRRAGSGQSIGSVMGGGGGGGGSGDRQVDGDDDGDDDESGYLGSWLTIMDDGMPMGATRNTTNTPWPEPHAHGCCAPSSGSSGHRDCEGEDRILALVSWLIGAGCDLNREDHLGNTPLQLARGAARNGALEALLLQHGATDAAAPSPAGPSRVNAATVGPPRDRSTFSDESHDEWHAYQESWYRAFASEELPSVEHPMRRVLWKRAVRAIHG